MEGFSKVIEVQAYAVFMILIIEYGFNYISTRNISKHAEDRKAISGFIGSTVSAKILLSIFLAVFTLAYITLLHKDFWMFMWGLLYSVASGFSPIWYFQGMQKIRFFSKFDITSRILSSVAIFLFVKSDETAYIYFLSYFIFITISNLMLYREILKHGFAFNINLADGITEITKGFQFFTTRVFMSMYTNLSIFMISHFVNPTSLAFYGAADKTVRSSKQMYAPVIQILFPKFSKEMSEIKRRKLESRSFWITLGVAGSINLIIYIFASDIVRILFGEKYLAGSTIHVMKVMSFIVLFNSLNNLLGVQWLMGRGCDSLYSRIVMVFGLMMPVVIYFSSREGDIIRIAYGVMLIELTLTFVFFVAYIFSRGNIGGGHNAVREKHNT